MVNPWPMIKIGDIFEFKNGLSKGKEFFGQGTPFISYVDVYKHNGLTAADIKGRVLLSEDEIRKLAVKSVMSFLQELPKLLRKLVIAQCYWKTCPIVFIMGSFYELDQEMICSI